MWNVGKEKPVELGHVNLSVGIMDDTASGGLIGSDFRKLRDPVIAQRDQGIAALGVGNGFRC